MNDKTPTELIEEQLAARQRSQESLDAELASAPIVEVVGVVGASGPSGCMLQGDEQWTMRFELEAWRVDGGPVVEQRLTVRRRVSRDELHELQAKIDRDTVVRLSARVLEETAVEGPQAYLEEPLGLVDDDSELLSVLEKLRAPVTYEDDQFGTFTWDRRINWYTAKCLWAGEEIELTLSAEQPEEIEPCLKAARALWADEQAWKQRVEDFAVEELLELKNDSWLGDGEDEVTPEVFKRRMTLQSIAIDLDGEFEFWHSDGDLFWGHSIQVSGNLEDGPEFADIPG